ncbi:integral membrane protein [Lactobacillus pasteurii DSM 23907 = CRBIP 24.76]|uniref:Integral membrane protein n=1 Tax=Lactobacillus pasteurii DSM 23907 = CRBIP 24.76 TaxID=1423790 RepID=I7LA98_9LACO|nr:TMEM175 family protein [Lactobacillus pasteurii]KRK07783.1 integral membrane protein [Lactobacillus pasteurii DSM 23907 = CRBIP 24.76]TDG77493.1 hypothetical protein C5L33_000936 [Lactobacillus pasteurii]CCI84496.1 Integral membrane protein [Lactobacillus pasteurii DSM 23907 = CRBIP 24.76]
MENKNFTRKSTLSTSLYEHLGTLNDGVIAIIMTIMIMSIPSPAKDAEYGEFLVNIANYAASFFIVGNFWYTSQRVFRSFDKVGKGEFITDITFLFFLSLIPVNTKWIITSPSKLGLTTYGIVYLLTQMSLIVVFVLGNYTDFTLKQILSRTIFRSMTLIIPFALIITFAWKVSLALYIVLPIISLILPDRRRTKKSE